MSGSPSKYHRSAPEGHDQLVRLDGETLPVRAWLERLGIRPSTYCARRARGWSVQEALTTPVAPTRRGRRAR